MSETILVERIVQGEDGPVWESQPVVINTKDDFAIDERNLDREVCRMGLILLTYADLDAELQAELKRKDEYVKFLHASLSAAHRSSAEKEGKKKTVAELQEAVITDPQYQGSLTQLHVLRANVVKVDHYWRIALNKSKMLEALSFRQNAEIRRAYN